MRAPTNRTGWLSLLEWAIASLLLTLTLIGAASIGILVAPFAIIAVVVAVRRESCLARGSEGGSPCT